MKNRVVFLVIIVVIVCFIIGFVIYWNNSIYNKEQIATINVKYSFPHISDVGSYERIRIFRDIFHKYKYTKESARVTVDGVDDYEFVESGTIESRNDLKDLFNSFYSNEVVHDEDEIKKMKEENNGKPPFSLFNETYIYVSFVYNNEGVGEETSGASNYIDIKERINKNYEQFENLLFK